MVSIRCFRISAASVSRLNQLNKLYASAWISRRFGIYHFGRTAYGSKVKAAFPFLNKVLHFPSATVELEYLIWLHFHGRDDESVQLDHLAIWLFNFENCSARMAPGICLIHEFAILHSIIYLVGFRCTVQLSTYLENQSIMATRYS